MSFPWKEVEEKTRRTPTSEARISTPRKPKITEGMVNEFMKWVKTVDVADYPKYRSVINQYQKYERNARFQILDLFRLWLEEGGR